MRVITLIAISARSSGHRGRRQRRTRAGHVDYSFLGQLTAVPANGQLPVTVQRANRAALRAMLGQPVAQTFAYSGKTEFLKWSHGVPSVVKPATSPPATSSGSTSATPPAPHSPTSSRSRPASSATTAPSSTRPTSRSTCSAARSPQPAANSVTLDVRGGNHNATRLLIGQPSSETFTVDDRHHLPALAGKVPTVISLGQLKVGDTDPVRIRAKKHATLAQVEATPAVHVGDHEPVRAAPSGTGSSAS